jgi:hypothetical protein
VFTERAGPVEPFPIKFLKLPENVDVARYQHSKVKVSPKFRSALWAIEAPAEVVTLSALLPSVIRPSMPSVGEPVVVAFNVGALTCVTRVEPEVSSVRQYAIGESARTSDRYEFGVEKVVGLITANSCRMIFFDPDEPNTELTAWHALSPSPPYEVSRTVSLTPVQVTGGEIVTSSIHCSSQNVSLEQPTSVEDVP